MQKNKKYMSNIAIIVLSGMLIFCFVMRMKQYSYASWVEEEDGKRYEMEDGQFAIGFSEIEDNRYYFDADGYLVKGKFYVEEEDAYYYSDENGVVQSGMIQDENAFYITDENGRLLTGFVDWDGKRYYFNNRAELLTGWFKYEQNWYYADAQGVLMTGLVTIEGYRYYLNADGTRVSDATMEIDGITYVFNKDGSIDENATMLYPVYEYINQIRKTNDLPEITMDTKVQACAILRAADLQEGYGNSNDAAGSVQDLLRNRGVMCSSGYEFSYGGIEEYTIDRLISDMGKDLNIIQVLKQKDLSAVGLGVYEQDGISYFDILFVVSNENENGGE